MSLNNPHLKPQYTKRDAKWKLEHEVKVPGLECDRSLPEGVPFANNMVIEEPEYVPQMIITIGQKQSENRTKISTGIEKREQRTKSTIRRSKTKKSTTKSTNGPTAKVNMSKLEADTRSYLKSGQHLNPSNEDPNNAPLSKIL
ncbi:hypothetical protein Tco_0673665 [Tanacetum coccineum]